MYKKLIKFIKNCMDSKSEQFSIRIPKDLKNILIKGSKSCRIPLPDYVRAIVVNSILPEILETKLKAELCEWITKQGKDSMEIHIAKRIKKLKEIAELANFAITETEKLQQKFIDLEVDYMNNINSRAEG